MSVQPRLEPSRGPSVAWWRVLSWQMYDFADTIYSMNVTSIYYGRWLLERFGASSLTYSLITTVANLLVAVVSPLMGAMSDASQRRLPFQRFFAFTAAAATVLIGLSGNLPMAMITFLISYLCYQAAGNFYQALLPGLAPPEKISTVSGIGVALGYVGSIAGLVMVEPFVADGDLGKAFMPTAVLFIAFALPGLFLVPDFADSSRKVKLSVAEAYGRLAETFRNAQQHRALFRFLVADFIYENAVAAVIANMGVYTKVVLGLDGDGFFLLMVTATAVAIIWSFLYGKITDWVGPKPAVIGMLLIWLVVFPLVAFTRSHDLFLYVVGPLVGMGLGSTWVSSRTFLIALTPVEKSGEFFGLYALSGKSAGVVGLGAWSLILYLLTGRLGEAGALQAACAAMGLFSLAGLVLVWGLPAVRPSKANILTR